MIGFEETYADPTDRVGNAAFATVLIGHYQAVQLEQLAAYARDTEGDEFAYLEVATQLHISDHAAQRRLKFARTLVERLPQTLVALDQGWIEEYKAQLIADAVAELSDEHALAVEAQVLDKAGQQTPTQLRNTLAKAVLAVDPEGAEERRKERVRGRRVDSYPTEPGMAALTIHHSAEKIATAHAVIADRARALKALGNEPRTLQQIEADVALDLVFGTDTGSNRVVEVHLTMPGPGAAPHPAEVDGLSVTAQAARELAAEATSWRWLRTDPHTGAVVDLTSPSYVPPQWLKTFVQVRDRTCRYPGCTRRARQCDVDHRVPWPQGATCDENCHCLCRRHHRAKHEGGWQVRTLGRDRLEWTSPLGFAHIVEPEPVTVPSESDPDPPPF
ncbi:MAG TPA: DUF222 domain-containing protein [Actinophytocola sp.]|uniref:HNH endonuclease signature motif containing protein n=1 Tax=Actinophytocola sp. TaxID=1872138 RepID=UPI002DDC9E59|nr:DUF222 domain-containing protein [Actinophytocola sp.]HEV2780507.1 DUF222 domain-containing protein [Actinophytocola sp.]